MKVHWTRRQALTTLCASAAASLAAPVLAQKAYPERVIKLIVGFPAGTITDTIFRTAAVEMARKLGQPVIVDNKPGAAGVPAYLAVKAAAPDGYTIGGINAAVWRQPVLEEVSYDPLRDFTYIANVGEFVFSVVVTASSPFKTWADLLAWGKENPQKVSFGAAPGLRQSAHIFMLEVMQREGVAWQPVPYSGSPAALNDVMAGHLTFSVDPVASAAGLVQSGKMRYLAVISDQRLKGWPDVPTFKELGYPLAIDSPIGVAGPAGMPPHVVQILQDAFKYAIEQPSMVQLFERTNSRARYMSSQELNRFVVKSEGDQRELLTRYGFARKR